VSAPAAVAYECRAFRRKCQGCEGAGCEYCRGEGYVSPCGTRLEMTPTPTGWDGPSRCPNCDEPVDFAIVGAVGY